MEKRKVQKESIFQLYDEVSKNEKLKIGDKQSNSDLEKRKRCPLKDIVNVKTLKFESVKNTSSKAVSREQNNVNLILDEKPLYKKVYKNQEPENSYNLSASKKSQNNSSGSEKRILDQNYKIYNPYAKVIYDNLRSIEILHQRNLTLNKFKVVEANRAKLINWMARAIDKFHLETETFYLSVSYVDRFLCNASVGSSGLMLVGTTAIFIAAKFQEIQPLRVKDLICASNNAYTKNEILEMELSNLRSLAFNIASPTHLAFLGCYCEKLPKNVKHLAMYLCELSLFETENYFNFLPSYLAAAAVFLAQHTLGEEIWSLELIFLSGYKLRYLRVGIIFLEKIFKKSLKEPQKISLKKYESKQYGHVSLLLPKSTSVYDFEDED